MYPRLSLRDGSWKIRSTPFTGSNETGRSRVNRSPTSNAWFSSGNVANTSLETAVFVDRVLERLETADVLIRPLAMPQAHTEGCLESCGDEPARDDPDRLGGDAAGSPRCSSKEPAMFYLTCFRVESIRPCVSSTETSK